jgi:hypothetical protein
MRCETRIEKTNRALRADSKTANTNWRSSGYARRDFRRHDAAQRHARNNSNANEAKTCARVTIHRQPDFAVWSRPATLKVAFFDKTDASDSRPTASASGVACAGMYLEDVCVVDARAAARSQPALIARRCTSRSEVATP